MISNERLKELLNYDAETGIFIWIIKRRGNVNIGSVAGGKKPDGYIHIKLDGKTYKAHRLSWLYVYGKFPEKGLDHINEVKDDNRIVNLRLATDQENMQNISSPRINNKSGYYGVSWNKKTNKWVAQIQINGKKKCLGFFKTIEEAYDVYKNAKRELHKFWVEK
jgi:HNH endonuclease/AP2 domain